MGAAGGLGATCFVKADTKENGFYESKVHTMV